MAHPRASQRRHSAPDRKCRRDVVLENGFVRMMADAAGTAQEQHGGSASAPPRSSRRARRRWTCDAAGSPACANGAFDAAGQRRVHRHRGLIETRDARLTCSWRACRDAPEPLRSAPSPRRTRSRSSACRTSRLQRHVARDDIGRARQGFDPSDRRDQPRHLLRLRFDLENPLRGADDCIVSSAHRRRAGVVGGAG